MKTKFLPAVLIPCVLLTSCNLSQKVDGAKQAVKDFHNRLNSGDYERIYDEADNAFKSATTARQFAGLLAAVHRKLGNVTSAEASGWSAVANTGGAFVNLSYNTQFGNEKAIEQFRWREEDGREHLVSYNINSAALITK